MKTCLRHTFIIVLVLAMFNLQIGPNFEIRVNQAQAQALQLEKLEGGNNNYMNLIMMLGVGIIAMTLIKRVVKPTTDIYIAAAGGAAFMAGELMSNDQGKKEVDQQNTDIKLSHDGTIDGNQLKSLEKLKESYQSVKKSAETKKMMQMAAAAAFGGAAVMAFMQKGTDDTLYAGCQKAKVEAEQSLQTKVEVQKCQEHDRNAIKHMMEVQRLTPIATAIPPMPATPAAQQQLPKEIEGVTKEQASAKLCRQEIVQCKQAVSSLLTKIDAYHKIKQVPKAGDGTMTSEKAAIGSESQSVCQAGQYVTHASIPTIVTKSCSPYFAHDGIILSGSNGTPVPGTSATGSFLEKKILKKPIFYFLSLLLPTAQAFDTKMLGLGIVGAGALMGFMSKSANMIDKFMNHPKNRAMVWAAMAALAFLASQSSAKEAQTAQSNIDKIDKLIQGMKSHTGGDTNPGASGTTELAAVGTQEIKAINPALVKGATNMRIGNDQKIPCLAGQSASGECNNFGAQLDDSMKKSFSNGVNPGIASFASQIGKLADSIQGKSSLSSGALASAQSVAAKAASMRRLSDAAKKKLNDMANKSGETPVPFDQMQKGLLDSLQSNAVASLKSKGYTPSAGELSSLSSGLQDLKHSTGEQNAASEKDPNATAAGKAVPAGSAIPIGGNGKDKGMDFDFLNENAAPTAGIDPNSTGITGPSPSSADALANFESEATSEINGQSNIPLWEIITVRYMKSGYPRLLDVDEKSAGPMTKQNDKQ